MEANKEKKFEKAMFGAGCFWHVEQAFGKVDGVVETAVGYAGGSMKNPKYEDVCSDETGHAEVVEVTYNPSKVKYEKLLDVFWNIHDPTQLNKQGHDVGTQYRSVIFYFNGQQKKKAIESKNMLEKSKKYSKPIATEIKPAAQFFRAEEYHQKYLQKRGLFSCAI